MSWILEIRNENLNLPAKLYATPRPTQRIGKTADFDNYYITVLKYEIVIELFHFNIHASLHVGSTTLYVYFTVVKLSYDFMQYHCLNFFVRFYPLFIPLL